MGIDIENVISTMKASNYFYAWEDSLLGNSVLNDWKKVLDDPDNESLYSELSIKLYEHKVPYVIVSEYIDEFFRYCNIDQHRHTIKNKIAKAYLHKQLLHDKESIEIELGTQLSVILESKRELINAHLNWMKNFISSIIEKPTYFELDPKKCFVGKWILSEKDNIPSSLVQKHINLHSMSESAIRMYHQKDYAYFLLLYMDILASSYQIRDAIVNIIFTNRIHSIYQDPLSGKFNYFQLKDDIQKYDKDVSILMFNIKDFKKMNLLYGHDVCDKLIRKIADKVDAIPEVIDTYRIYGDEFAILFPTKDAEKVITLFKEKLYKHEFTFANERMSISFYGSYAELSKHVLEYCEYGLMLSKKHYGDIVNVNSTDKKALFLYADELHLSKKLQFAFVDNRIISHYQPIEDIKTGKITKHEVLMRVQNIDGSIMFPGEFLDSLEDMYLYPEVTKLMIKNSFDFFKDKECGFSINLLYSDLINEDTKAFILEIIKENPQVASRCTFELLEYEAIVNLSDVSTFFSDLHSCGVSIALDDFGTGYSNYDVIFNMKIDYIKIDGSLTESMLTSEKSKVVVESIVEVSKKLGIKIVIEFVSSEEIYNAVKGMGIDYAQGYHIGKPSAQLVC